MSQIGDNVKNIVIGVVAAVVFILVGVALGPTLLSATADINATSVNATEVPMASVIILLATYVGFFFYLGIVLGGIAMIWATVNKNR